MSTPGATDRRVVKEFPMLIFRPKCPKCNETFAKPPLQWNCPNDGVKTWQRYELVSSCTVCGVDISPLNRRHCHRCGHVCCNECGQYFMQLIGGAGGGGGGGQRDQKERVCKGCAFPPTAPDVTGNLLKISRDVSGKETSRNVRYFELRQQTLMYSVDQQSVWRGFYDMQGVKVADDVDEPSLGFTISGGRLPRPLHLVADKVPDKTKWVNTIMAAASGGVGVGGQAHENTEADGHAGFMDLLDGPNQATFFFRLKGTELKMSKSKTEQPFDAIILHGGTVIQEDPRDPKVLLVSGPRLKQPLKLVCKDEVTRNGWKRNILCAMRGGKYGSELPQITLKTQAEGARGTGARSRDMLELREHVLVWQQDAIDLRGTTVSVDPNRARNLTISGGGANPALSLRFDHDMDFAYWKDCLQAVAAGKPMPFRRFSGAPDIQGFLIKIGAPRGTSGSVAQNKRHFRLFDHFLQYSEVENGPTKGEFDVLEAEVSDSSSYPLGFFLSGPRMKRPLVLVAETEELRNKWKRLIASAAGGTPTVNTGPASPRRRKGVGLQRGVAAPINLSVTIEISRERQDPRSTSSQLGRWHGATVPLTGLDATACTLEDLQNLVESVLDIGNSGVGGAASGDVPEFGGVILIPGRYIAFRTLSFDDQDEVSPAAEHLQELRDDDDVAHLLHRLPDATYLDEIPLRSGDKLVWKDLAMAAPSPLRSDKSRYLPVAAAAASSSGSPAERQQKSTSASASKSALPPSKKSGAATSTTATTADTSPVAGSPVHTEEGATASPTSAAGSPKHVSPLHNIDRVVDARGAPMTIDDHVPAAVVSPHHLPPPVLVAGDVDVGADVQQPPPPAAAAARGFYSPSARPGYYVMPNGNVRAYPAPLTTTFDAKPVPTTSYAQLISVEIERMTHHRFT